MPAVSVVMPVFNAERYVARTVRSVLAQTFGDFEFIAIDDGSTDGSPHILRAYAARDGRIRLTSRPNRGVLETLNEGLRRAAGEFVWRIDADDLAHPTLLEAQVRRMRQEPGLVVLGTSAVAIDAEGRPLGDYGAPPTHEEIEACHLRGHQAVHHPGALIRARALRQVGGYRPGFTPCDEYDLWLRLGEVGRLANLSEPLLQKRLCAEGMVSTTLGRQARISELILREAWRRRGLPGEPRPTPRVLHTRGDLFRQWAWMALKARHVHTGRRYALKALAAEPFRKASWKLLACSLRGR